MSEPGFVCDCGQRYSSPAAVRECQATNHSAAAGNELADAQREARLAGVPDESGEAELLADRLRQRYGERLKIEQRPHEGVTIINGTRYSNELLRMLGQDSEALGPFLIVMRKDG